MVGPNLSFGGPIRQKPQDAARMSDDTSRKLQHVYQARGRSTLDNSVGSTSHLA